MAADMEFGLLGPLVVRSGAVSMAVPRGGQRAVLAALLLSANHVVSLDELAEALWGTHPPRSARVTTQNYVKRLRQALGLAGERIGTHPNGYLVRVETGELDVSRFEALAESVRAAVKGEVWDQASARADAALGLWRGEPLADIESVALTQREVPRLTEIRLQMLETRLDAELHLGGHVEVIPELNRLTHAYPLRESLRALLMLALYRSGRQAEALAAFQAARRLLVDELGSEPGSELRELQRRILACDPALAVPQPQPASVGSIQAVPRELPSAVRVFIGRRKELALLDALTGEGPARGAVVVSAIDGMAGVGKTALAVHAGHRLASKFPDGQLFIDLHGYTQDHEPRAPGDALAWLLRALGVPPQRIPQDVDERAAVYRQRLAGSRTLIVLDNAASEAQVRQLLPGSSECLVLVTSRRRLKGLEDGLTLALDALPTADAIALLRTVAGTGQAPADDPVLAEIAGLCGRLPLALRIAAALLRHRPAWTLEHLAGLLRDQQQRITALSDGEHDLGVVFDLSYRTLPGAHQRLFRRLGLIPGPDFDAYATAVLTGTDPATAGRMLEDLVDHNLLIEQIPGRYRFHDLIRLHARTLIARDPVSERDAALGQLLDYYQHTAGRAEALIARHPRPAPAGPAPAHPPALPDRDAAWAWLRAERSNLLAAVQHTSRGNPECAIALTAGLATLLYIDGPWAQAVALHTAAAAAAQDLGDRAGRADALTRLGTLRALTGGFREPARDLEQALQLYRDIGERRGQAETLAVLGELRRVTGDLPAAARDLEQALRLSQDLAYRPGQAEVLLQRGDMRRAAGDLAGAARDLEQALQLYQDLENGSGQADVLTRLGDMRRVTGDLRGAARDLEQALQIYRDLGRRLGQANALARLGDIRRAADDLPGAARDLEEALQLYRDLGHQLGQANTLTFLGQVRLSHGDHKGAASHLEAAADLFRRIGAVGNQAWALNHYANVIAATGDHARANTIYQNALRLAREAHHPDDEALALEGIGRYHVHTGDTQVGAAHLRQALAIFKRLGMKPETGRVRTRLAELPGP